MADVNLDQSDERLDARVRQHLASELDGQLGRSLAHFRRNIGAGAAPRALSYAPVRASRRGPWVIGAIGSAIAASVAAVLLVPHIFMPTKPIGGVPVPTVRDPLQTILVKESVHSRDFDRGLIISSDGSPVRRIHRVNLHERRWRDPETDAEIEQIVPSEEELYFELKTY